MKLFALIALSLLASPLAAQTLKPWEELKFETVVNGSPLVIKGDRKFAGAVSTVTYRNQNYVNQADHGRLFQGAIAFSARFECLNPTQAGASRDRLNIAKRSTSRRLEAILSPKAFSVTTQMAYWLRPGQFCDIPGQGRTPVDNRQRLSDVIYRIENRQGVDGFDNVFAMKVTYSTKTPQRSAVVEAATIYMPPDFNTFHDYDPKSGLFQLQPTERPDETDRPIVLSTSDGAHAFAFITQTNGATYGRWRWPDTSKISIVYRPVGPFAGTQVYEGFWAIGTREEVMKAVQTLTE